MLSPYERILRSHKVLNDDETPLGPPWSPWPPWAPLGAPGPPAPPLGPPGCPRRAILSLELSQRKPVFGDVPGCLYVLTSKATGGGRRHPWGLADSGVSFCEPRSTRRRCCAPRCARPWRAGHRGRPKGQRRAGRRSRGWRLRGNSMGCGWRCSISHRCCLHMSGFCEATRC